MSKAKKKPRQRREMVSPFSKIKHIHDMVEQGRGSVYAFARCAVSGCLHVKTVLLEED
jgi:hypothetical protein